MLQHSTEHPFAPLAVQKWKEKFFDCLQRFHMQPEMVCAESEAFRRPVLLLRAGLRRKQKREISKQRNVSKWWNLKEIYRFRVVGKYFDSRKVSANSDNECEYGTACRNVKCPRKAFARSINFNAIDDMRAVAERIYRVAGVSVTTPPSTFIESAAEACFRSADLEMCHDFRQCGNWWANRKSFALSSSSAMLLYNALAPNDDWIVKTCFENLSTHDSTPRTRINIHVMMQRTRRISNFL